MIVRAQIQGLSTPSRGPFGATMSNLLVKSLVLRIGGERDGHVIVDLVLDEIVVLVVVLG